MVYFADISHHNAGVDLLQYKAVGHDRIVLKATEALNFIDDAFSTRWVRAKKLGLDRVAYHFLRNNFSGKEQAEFLVKTVDEAGGLGDTDIFMLDTEDEITPELAKTCTVNFTERMVDLGFNNGLVYSGKYYLDPGRITSNSLPSGWRNLFISDYSSVTDNNIFLPVGWSREQLVARQFTNKAQVTGLGPVDYSRLLKEWIDMPLTVIEFKKLLEGALGGPAGKDAWHLFRQIAAEGCKDAFRTTEVQGILKNSIDIDKLSLDLSAKLEIPVDKVKEALSGVTFTIVPNINTN